MEVKSASPVSTDSPVELSTGHLPGINGGDAKPHNNDSPILQCSYDYDAVNCDDNDEPFALVGANVNDIDTDLPLHPDSHIMKGRHEDDATNYDDAMDFNRQQHFRILSDNGDGPVLRRWTHLKNTNPGMNGDNKLPSLGPESVDELLMSLLATAEPGPTSRPVSIYHQPPKAADRNAAQRLAKRLYYLEGFKMRDVAKHLIKRNEFSELVGEEYLNHFQFTGLTLDLALRDFLSKFILLGDTSDRERILQFFSRRYHQCNPTAYASEAACHYLTCCLLILNADLHNQPTRTTQQEFIASLRGMNEGGDFAQDELTDLYESLRLQPIQWPVDHDGVVVPAASKVNGSSLLLANPHGGLPLMNGMLQYSQAYLTAAENNQLREGREFMRGFLLRKCVLDVGGKKVRKLRRGWKAFYARLKGLNLFLYRVGDFQKFESAFSELNLMQRHQPPLNAAQMQMVAPDVTVLPPPSTGESSAADAPDAATSASNGTNASPDAETKVPDVSRAVEAEENKTNSTGSSTSGSNGNAPSSNMEVVSSNMMSCWKFSSSSSPPAVAYPGAQQHSNSGLPSSVALPEAQHCLMLHHSFAWRDPDYTKKPNVYRLRLHNAAEFQLRTYGSVEMEHWIVQLNYAAALLSPPVAYQSAFTSISDGGDFIRPTYPLTYTNAVNARQQLETHLSQLSTCMTELSTMQSNAPPKSAKNKAKLAYEAKHDFLTSEIERLKTYVRLLEVHLNGWDTASLVPSAGAMSALPSHLIAAATSGNCASSAATASPSLIPPQLVAAALDKDDSSFLVQQPPVTPATREGALVYDVL